MIKKICLSFIFLLIGLNVFAQKFSKLPENKISSKETEAHLRFLAADEMLGRKTGEQGNNVAARYIAEQFRLLGVKPVAGQNDYIQPVLFNKSSPIKEATLIVNGTDTLKNIKDFVALEGKQLNQKAEVVFVPFGASEADYNGLDVKGKVVVVQFGKSDNSGDINESFSAMEEKKKLATKKGAFALIEIFTAQIPWQNVAGYLGREQLKLAKKEIFAPYFLLNGAKAHLFSKEKAKEINIILGEKAEKILPSQNVVGVIEGTDPTLKNEYIILSAHFDHVGTGAAKGSQDTIFNGARDNAFGTSAMLFAAKTLTQIKPKRSILLIGFTGEEVGLLGSEYYAEHPLVPLNKCVFNFNCDGAGYNDTKLLTTIGLSRTDCKTEMEMAATKYALTIKDDPAPEQNLFDRSDNVRFAAKGIPAPTYAPGFTAFDDAIFKYYHQTSDNPDNVDLAYFHKYCQVYAYAARLIANRKTQPKWTTGDKYEAAYKTLYGVK